MSFLDNFGRKALEAAQEVAKKSGELVEVAKLNISIANEEDKIKRLYEKMGKMIYDAYKEKLPIDSKFEETCREIDTIFKNIESMRKKIQKIKNIKRCVQCGTELQQDALYCMKCGARQSEVQDPDDNEEEEAVKVCPVCHEPLEVEANFCTKCGAQINE